MRLRTTTIALTLALGVSSSCSSGSSRPGPGTGAATLPNFAAATFANPTSITNALALFPASFARTYVTDDGEDIEIVVIERLALTNDIQGVTCAAVKESDYADDLLVEETTKWLAQDDVGNVWQMGEDVAAYEYDDDDQLIDTSTEGSWEAGQDPDGVGTVASPGYLVPASLALNQSFFRAHYPGVVMDTAKVVSLAEPVSLANGSSYTCVQLETKSDLDPTDTSVQSLAQGTGFVFESSDGGTDTTELRGEFDFSSASMPNFAAASFSNSTVLDHPYFTAPSDEARIYIEVDDDEVETVVIERVPGIRMVDGVACAIVRDRVFFEGNIKEDTHDWFAQDDAGNVWYMGEEVVNYVYDDDGDLLSTNTNGSWEAGLDIAGTGTNALAGFQLPANPTLGSSFYQEFYPQEAIDMGIIEVDDAVATLPLGGTVAGCLRSLDWNPLDRAGLETKLYGPGIGLVSEAGLHSGAGLQLYTTYDVGSSSLPNFGAAVFTASTLVDHTYFPLPTGATWSFEADTEDGVETVEAEVVAMTRIVAGVTCVTVHVEEFLDGVIQEATDDWYAQDDAGNVWYMGEEVTNYEYDDNGVLTGTNDDGSWEAGLDVAGTGSNAVAGYAIPADTSSTATYFQEFYEDEAEDLARIVQAGITLVVDGTTYNGCIRTIDWNPLDGDGLEYKVYAPGIGVVVEEDLIGGVATELVATSL